MNQTTKKVKKKIKNTNRKREVGINIRVTPEEKIKIRNLADACKVSISELIRQLLAGQQIRAIPPEAFYETKDKFDIIESILTSYQSTPQEILDAFRAFIAEFETIVKNFYSDTDGSFAKQYCDRVHQKWEAEAERYACRLVNYSTLSA